MPMMLELTRVPARDVRVGDEILIGDKPDRAMVVTDITPDAVDRDWIVLELAFGDDARVQLLRSGTEVDRVTRRRRAVA